MKASKGEMSFLDHLEELRKRVIWSALAVFICSVPCWIFWRPIFNILMVYPLRIASPKPQLIFTSPAEAVVLSFKIAFAGGVVAAAPVIFYHLWRFIGPGLYKKEKIIVLPTVVASTLCFLLGAGFSYLLLPYMMRVLTAYGSGLMQPYFKAGDYMGFVIKIVLAFGIVFELPVLSFVLTRFGVITPRFLVSKARYAIVLIFIVAAVLTPPDVLSQIVLAVPLMVLYGVSIGVSYLARGKDA